MLLRDLFTSPIQTLVVLAAIVVAVTVHEFAHAWTAVRLGDDTPLHQGRVTLNPASHLDLWGSICFVVAGFGWGKPVVYNPMRLSHRRDELLVALAGPASNILLAIIFNILLAVQTHSGITVIYPAFLELAALVNIYLAAFNLIPIPPLDGSSILAYFWPAYRSIVGGQIGLVILLLLILPLGFSGSILSTILNPVIGVIYWITHLFGLL